jgi:hypothetical protein
MQYDIEMTDTFAGEANYCWVRRATIAAPATATSQLLVRRAKKALGITGRHKLADFGDLVRLDLLGACICVFITPHYGA